MLDGCPIRPGEPRVAPELQWVRLGRVKIVAVTELQRWLDESAEAVFDPRAAGRRAVEKHGDALRRLSGGPRAYTERQETFMAETVRARTELPERPVDIGD